MDTALTPVVWIDYAQQKPDKAGWYRWRMKHRRMDFMLQFNAEFRKRGAGYTHVLSPDFDHWDGYNINVPACEWQELPEGAECTSLDRQVTVEGIVNLPCPFCGTIPTFDGYNGNGGGVWIGAKPLDYNTWYLRCCGWVKDFHKSNPVELSALRNSRILAHSDQNELLAALEALLAAEKASKYDFTAKEIDGLEAAMAKALAAIAKAKGGQA